MAWAWDYYIIHWRRHIIIIEELSASAKKKKQDNGQCGPARVLFLLLFSSPPVAQSFSPPLLPVDTFLRWVCAKNIVKKKKNMIAMLEWIHLRSYDSPACLTAWNWNRRFTTHSLTHSVRHSQHRRLGLRFCLTSFAVVVVIKVFFLYLRTLCVLVSVSISIWFFFFCFSFHYYFISCAVDSNPTWECNWELGLGLGSGYCKSSPR